jgi:hypothetical protein
VLGLGGPRQQVGSDRRRQYLGRIDGGGRLRQAGQVLQHRRGPQKPPGLQRGAKQPGLQQRRRCRAQADLTGAGRRFHVGGDARRRAADEQLSVDVRVTDEEEVELAAVHADRHSQGDAARRSRQPPDDTQLRPHPVRRPRCPEGMVVALTQQQHRVPAPLDQVGTVVLCVGEQSREGLTENVAHLFGADIAPPREALGEPGEARDVDERQGAADPHVSGVITGWRPIAQQHGDVGQQPCDSTRDIGSGHGPRRALGGEAV